MIAALLVALVGAAQGAIPARSISFEEAQQAALQRHPLVHAARVQTRAASARAGQAASIYWPQIFAQAEYIRSTQNGSNTVLLSFPDLARIPSSTPKGVGTLQMINNFVVAGTVHQLLYDFGKTAGAVAAQEALVVAARMNERLIEQSVIFAAAQAWFATLAAGELLKAAEESLRRTQRTLEFARSADREGLRPPNEVARAEADAAAARLVLIRARGGHEIARTQLSKALGAPEEPVEPDGVPPRPAPPRSEAETKAEALALRPELLALAARRKALEEQLRSTNASHLPSLEATGSISSRGQFLPLQGQSAYDVLNLDVGVILRVPLFQGFLVQERSREVESELAVLGRVLEDVRQTVALEVKQATLGLSWAEEAVAAAKAAVLAAKVSLEISAARFENGLANIVEMSDAEAAYVSAQTAAARAAFEAQLGQALLRRAIGSTAPQR